MYVSHIFKKGHEWRRSRKMAKNFGSGTIPTSLATRLPEASAPPATRQVAEPPSFIASSLTNCAAPMPGARLGTSWWYGAGVSATVLLVPQARQVALFALSH